MTFIESYASTVEYHVSSVAVLAGLYVCDVVSLLSPALKASQIYAMKHSGLLGRLDFIRVRSGSEIQLQALERSLVI
jgi:hypothetical protein